MGTCQLCTYVLSTQSNHGLSRDYHVRSRYKARTPNTLRKNLHTACNDDDPSEPERLVGVSDHILPRCILVDLLYCQETTLLAQAHKSRNRPDAKAKKESTLCSPQPPLRSIDLCCSPTLKSVASASLYHPLDSILPTSNSPSYTHEPLRLRTYYTTC